MHLHLSNCIVSTVHVVFLGPFPRSFSFRLPIRELKITQNPTGQPIKRKSICTFFFCEQDMHLPAFACCAFFFSRSLAEPGGTAVARTCWTRPPLVRPVSRGPPRRHKAPGLAKFRIPATVRRCCHPVTGWGWGWGWAWPCGRARSRAPDSHHQTAATRAAGGGQRPRAAEVRGSRGGWQRTWQPTPPRARGVEAAEPQLCVGGSLELDVGFGGWRTVRCTRPQGGMAPHAALPPRGSDRASAETRPRATTTHPRAKHRVCLWAYYYGRSDRCARCCPIGPSLANLGTLASCSPIVTGPETRPWVATHGTNWPNRGLLS